MSHKDIYVGIHATDTLPEYPINRDIEGIKRFKLACQSFLIELVNQIRSTVGLEQGLLRY